MGRDHSGWGFVDWQSRGQGFESPQLHNWRYVETSAIAGVSACLGSDCEQSLGFSGGILTENASQGACRGVQWIAG